MADTKISAMPAATEGKNADLIAIVQGGVNKKITRTLFFTAGVGETIAIIGDGVNSASLSSPTGTNQIAVVDGGGVTTLCDDGFSLSDVAASHGMQITPAGQYDIHSAGGAVTMTVRSGVGASMVMQDMAGTIVFVCAGGMFCPYLDGSAGSWTAPAPTNFNTAIDRLAVAVRGILGGGPVL